MMRFISWRGFEDELRQDGKWKFTRWELIDLAHLRVKLKAEFLGSNRDPYRPETIVATSLTKRIRSSRQFVSWLCLTGHGCREGYLQ